MSGEFQSWGGRVKRGERREGDENESNESRQKSERSERRFESVWDDGSGTQSCMRDVGGRVSETQKSGDELTMSVSALAPAAAMAGRD